MMAEMDDTNDFYLRMIHDLEAENCKFKEISYHHHEEDDSTLKVEWNDCRTVIPRFDPPTLKMTILFPRKYLKLWSKEVDWSNWISPGFKLDPFIVQFWSLYKPMPRGLRSHHQAGFNIFDVLQVMNVYTFWRDFSRRSPLKK